MFTAKKAAAAAVTAVTGLVLVAAPAAASASATTAAYPTNGFDVTFGATYARGTLTWFDRAVRAEGTLRSLSSSGCRRAYAATYDSNGAFLDHRSTSAQCGDAIKPFTLNVPANVRGGAAITVVCLLDRDGAPLSDDSCVGYYRPGA